MVLYDLAKNWQNSDFGKINSCYITIISVILQCADSTPWLKSVLFNNAAWGTSNTSWAQSLLCWLRREVSYSGNPPPSWKKKILCLELSYWLVPRGPQQSTHLVGLKTKVNQTNEWAGLLLLFLIAFRTSKDTKENIVVLKLIASYLNFLHSW